MDINRIMIIGNLVRDPETNYTKGENPTAITRITIASDGYKKKDGTQEVNYVPCKAFGNAAEVISKYCKKGSKIAIEGSWLSGSYDKDGTKVYTNECKIDMVQLLSKKEEAPAEEAPAAPEVEVEYDGDLPF